MGTALEVAQAIQQTLTTLNHTVKINPAFSVGDLQDPEEVILICTSNTGMGDLPGNIMPLLQHLKNDCPNIAGRQFGLVNLGDSSYPNFAQAGKTLAEAMVDLGAAHIDPELILDAIYVDDYAQEATDWANSWAQKLK